MKTHCIFYLTNINDLHELAPALEGMYKSMREPSYEINNMIKTENAAQFHHCVNEIERIKAQVKVMYEIPAYNTTNYFRDQTSEKLNHD